MGKKNCDSKEEKTEDTANDIIDKKGLSSLVMWLFWLKNNVRALQITLSTWSDKVRVYHQSVLPPEPVPHWSMQSVKHYNPRWEQLLSPRLLSSPLPLSENNACAPATTDHRVSFLMPYDK
ncbi:hypothetical protein ATANTOWER_023234 [Ataeniobius toweri]|uniref:Uncharacterized protein n=1 Tax=Ataeniobius toweri TaxID=208326 RepID=A0ABU7AR57_9TELE|nr:hypothetical protein [Ataeniobius toweri]